jgi:hypothetical protein
LIFGVPVFRVKKIKNQTKSGEAFKKYFQTNKKPKKLNLIKK